MKILVTGATGRVGQYLVAQLNDAGHQVVALTRNPAGTSFPEGVEVVKGDLTQPETLAAALEGVEGLHLIKFGGDNYAPLKTGQELIALAEKAGVKRITVLMGRQKGDLEAAVENSSIPWTFLLPVEFMSGIMDWAEPIRSVGSVNVAFPDRKTAIVHEADIAAVALKALTEEGHGGKTYTITGPEVLSPRKIITLIGEVIGRDIPIVELSEAQAREEFQAAHYPAEVIEFLMWVYGNTPPVGYTVVPTIEEVTGQPARTCREWVQENIQQFRA